MHHRCVGSEFVPSARRKSCLLNTFGFRALYIWGNNDTYATTRAPFFFFVGSPKFASPSVGPFFLTFLIMACTANDAGVWQVRVFRRLQRQRHQRFTKIVPSTRRQRLVCVACPEIDRILEIGPTQRDCRAIAKQTPSLL